MAQALPAGDSELIHKQGSKFRASRGLERHAGAGFRLPQDVRLDFGPNLSLKRAARAQGLWELPVGYMSQEGGGTDSLAAPPSLGTNL